MRSSAKFVGVVGVVDLWGRAPLVHASRPLSVTVVGRRDLR
jgi:hypothetical protein